MRIIKNDLTLDIGSEINFLHTSDNHLSHADERDTERKVKLAKQRYIDFGGLKYDYENELDEAVDYCKRNCDMLLHTGDIMDFVSCRNLDLAKEKLSSCEYFLCAGNHEYSLYVGEAKEDEAYRDISLGLVSGYFNNDLTFASRIYKGINLVAVDNGYYYFRKSQTEMLKKEIDKGFPIILLLHVPLYTKELYEASMTAHRNYCAYLCGVPEDLTKVFDPYRYEQQRTSEETEEFIKLVEASAGKNGIIKLILAGHLHFDWQGYIYGIPQLVTGGGVARSARHITITGGRK